MIRYPNDYGCYVFFYEVDVSYVHFSRFPDFLKIH